MEGSCMSSGLSEAQARSLLAELKSPAADQERYAATRLEGGWLFSWGATTPVPIGSGPWVVSDAAQVRRVPIGKRAAEVLTELASPT
jgi:hypothetical protein